MLFRSLIALLDARFINLAIDGHQLTDTAEALFVIAITAGFTERFAADFLTKLSISARNESDMRQPASLAHNETDITRESAKEQGARKNGAPPAGGESEPQQAGTSEPLPQEEQPEPDEDETEAAGEDMVPATAEKPLG